MNTLIENIRTAPDSEIAQILESTSDAEFARLSAKEAIKICDLVLSAVEPHMAARFLTKFQTPVLKAMLLKCSLDSLTHFLSVTQASQLTKILANADNELVSKLIEAAPSRGVRIGLAKALPVERRKYWLEIVRSMESDLDNSIDGKYSQFFVI